MYCKNQIELKIQASSTGPLEMDWPWCLKPIVAFTIIDFSFSVYF